MSSIHRSVAPMRVIGASNGGLRTRRMAIGEKVSRYQVSAISYQEAGAWLLSSRRNIGGIQWKLLYPVNSRPDSAPASERSCGQGKPCGRQATRQQNGIRLAVPRPLASQGCSNERLPMTTTARAESNASEALSAFGKARSTIQGTPLSAEELRKTDAFGGRAPTQYLACCICRTIHCCGSR